MLPLDVANSGNGRDGGFPMTTLWLVVYIMMAALIVVIIPFAAFYYEADEYDETGYVNIILRDERRSQGEDREKGGEGRI